MVALVHHSSSIDVEPKWASAASIVRLLQSSRQLYQLKLAADSQLQSITGEDGVSGSVCGVCGVQNDGEWGQGDGNTGVPG